MKLASVAIALCAFTLASFESVQTEKKLRPIAGSNVSLVFPPDFVQMEKQATLTHSETGSAITVLELKFSIEDLSKGMTRESLAKRGMVLVSNTERQVNGRLAYDILVTQHAQGVEFHKHILIFGDDKNSVMLTGVVLDQFVEKTLPVVHEAMLSATWIPPGKQELWDGLDFRVSSTNSMKITQRSGPIVELARDQATDQPDSHQPLIHVGKSSYLRPMDDLESISRFKASTNGILKELTELSSRSTSLGGARAHEFVADAIHRNWEAPCRLYQVIIPGENCFYFLQGVAAREGWNESLKEFREVVATFKLVPEAD